MLLCRSNSLTDAERAVATLACPQAVFGPVVISGNRGAMAHPCRPGQSGSGTSDRQSPISGKCPRVLVFLFSQRARIPFPRHALSARLQPHALCLVLARPPGLVISMEPISSRHCGGYVEDAPSLVATPASRCRADRKSTRL